MSKTRRARESGGTRRVQGGGLQSGGAPPTLPVLSSNTPTATGFKISWTGGTPGATKWDFLTKTTPAIDTAPTISGTTATFTGLSSNTTYSVILVVSNALNESTTSAPINATTLPGVPTGLQLAAGVGVTPTSVALSWSPIPGNAIITSYTFKNGSNTLTPLIAPSGAVTTATFSGLTANTTYNITIVATNSAGSSAASSAFSVTTGPRTLVLTANGPTTSEPTKFTVSCSPSGPGTLSTTFTVTPAGPVTSTTTGTSYSFTGALTNTKYKITGITVSTYSDQTTSTSAISNEATLITWPAAPTAPVVSNITMTGCTLTWQAVPGTEEITYKINTSTPTSTTSTTTNVNGLTANSLYNYIITAEHTANSANKSTGRSFTVITQPAKPTLGATAKSISSTGFYLDMTAGAGGVAMNYTFKVNGQDPPVLPSVSTGKFTFTGLSPSTTYKIIAIANNSSGVPSEASNEVTAVTGPAVPAFTLTNITSPSSAVGQAEVLVSWAELPAGVTYTVLGLGSTVARTTPTSAVHRVGPGTSGVSIRATQGTLTSTSAVQNITIPQALPGCTFLSATNSSIRFAADSRTAWGHVRFTYTVDGETSPPQTSGGLGTPVTLNRTTYPSFTPGSTHSIYVTSIDANGGTLDSATIVVILSPDGIGFPTPSQSTYNGFRLDWKGGSGNSNIFRYVACPLTTTSDAVCDSNLSVATSGPITAGGPFPGTSTNFDRGTNITGLNPNTAYTFQITISNTPPAVTLPTTSYGGGSETASFNISTGPPRPTVSNFITTSPIGVTSNSCTIDISGTYAGVQGTTTRVTTTGATSFLYAIDGVNVAAVESQKTNILARITSTVVWSGPTRNSYISQNTIQKLTAGFSGLAPGDHTLVVTAVTSAGSSPSEPYLFTFAPDAPSAITPSASNVLYNQITITWTGGTGSKNYVFTLNEGPPPVPPIITGNSAIFKGLNASTTYSITILGSNSAGSSPVSEPVTVTTPMAPPVAPTALTFTNITGTSFTVSWTPGARTSSYTYMVNNVEATPTSSGTSSASFGGYSVGLSLPVVITAKNISGSTSSEPATVNLLTQLQINQASSAVQQADSSAQQQTYSAALPAIASSALQQQDSSATQQTYSSATQQQASSAEQQDFAASAVTYRYILISVFGPRSSTTDPGIHGFFLKLNNKDAPWNQNAVCNCVLGPDGQQWPPESGAPNIAPPPRSYFSTRSNPLPPIVGPPLGDTIPQNIFKTDITQNRVWPLRPLGGGKVPSCLLIDNTVPITFNQYYFGTLGNINPTGTPTRDVIKWSLHVSNDGINFYLIDDHSAAPQPQLVPPYATSTYTPPISLKLPSVIKASSANIQVDLQYKASSAEQQVDSSARQQGASSATQQTVSSATQQQASSATQQSYSSAMQQSDSSAQQQGASSATQQQASSATQQEASSATQQQASSATQQGVSSAEQQVDSSARQQQASSAQREQASSAEQQGVSSAVQQQDSSAQAEILAASAVTYRYILISVFGPRSSTTDPGIHGFFLKLNNKDAPWNQNAVCNCVLGPDGQQWPPESGAPNIAPPPRSYFSTRSNPLPPIVGPPLGDTIPQNIFKTDITQNRVWPLRPLGGGKVPSCLLIDNTVPITFNQYYFGTLGNINPTGTPTRDVIKWSLHVSNDGINFYLIDDHSAAPQTQLVPTYPTPTYTPPIPLTLPNVKKASSANIQVDLQYKASSAEQQVDSSAQQQVASSATQQTVSSALQQEASSATQQTESSAQQQGVSSAQQQVASSATQQEASSALQQEASSATQQGVSSAQQQGVSSAQQQVDSSAQQQQASSATQQTVSSATQQTESSAKQQGVSSATQQVASSAIVETLQKATVSYRYILFTIYGVRGMFPQAGGAQSGGGAVAPSLGNFTLKNLNTPVAWQPNAVAAAVHPYTLAQAVDNTGNPVVFTGGSTASYPSVLTSGVVATIQPAETPVGPAPTSSTVYVPKPAAPSVPPSTTIGPGITGYRYFLLVINGIRQITQYTPARAGVRSIPDSNIDIGGFTVYNNGAPVDWNPSITVTSVDNETLAPVYASLSVVPSGCLPAHITYGTGTSRPSITTIGVAAKLTFYSSATSSIVGSYTVPSVVTSLLIDNKDTVKFDSYSFSTGREATNDVLQWKLLGSMDKQNFYMIDDKSAEPQTALVPNLRFKLIPPISISPSAPGISSFVPSTTATPIQPLPAVGDKFLMFTNFKVRNPAKPYPQTASITLYYGRTPVAYTPNTAVLPPTDSSGNSTVKLLRNAIADVGANGATYIVNLSSPYIIIDMQPVSGKFPMFNGYSFTTSTSPNGESDLIGWTLYSASTLVPFLRVLDDRSQIDNTNLVPISPDKFIPIIPITSWNLCGTKSDATTNSDAYNMFTAARAAPLTGGRKFVHKVRRQRGGALSTYVIQPGAPVTAESFPTAILVDNKLPISFNSYTFATSGNSAADPIKWTFQASNDGVNFYLLDDRSLIPQIAIVPDVRNVLVSPPIPLNYSTNQAASSAEVITVSSAVQQGVSSAEQQVDSSAQQQVASSATQQEASSATQQQASSATQQGVSSALQQQSSSAQQQEASSATQQQASSATQQQASSATQQGVSSAFQQQSSSAQQQDASSATQQQASSATQQGVSSATQQQASSSQQQELEASAITYRYILLSAYDARGSGQETGIDGFFLKLNGKPAPWNAAATAMGVMGPNGHSRLPAPPAVTYFSTAINPLLPAVTNENIEANYTAQLFDPRLGTNQIYPMEPDSTQGVRGWKPRCILIDNKVPITFNQYYFGTTTLSPKDIMKWSIHVSNDGINFYMVDDHSTSNNLSLVPDNGTTPTYIPPISLTLSSAKGVSSAIQQQASSATQQQASSATQQQASSSTQQQASSATQQQASSATQQQASSATQQQASSATQQQASSSTQQQASSATQQRFSSAILPTPASGASSLHAGLMAKLTALQAQAAAQKIIAYSPRSTPTAVKQYQETLVAVAAAQNAVLAGNVIIRKTFPDYVDLSMQPIVRNPALSAIGITQRYDIETKKYVYYNEAGKLVANPLAPVPV